MKQWIAIMWVVMAAVSFGMLTPLIKIGYEQGWMVSHMTSSQLLAGAIFLWLCIIWRKPSRVSGSGDRFSLVIGFLGLGFSTVAYNQSLSWHPGSVAILWMFQYVWMTVALESMVSRRWPNRNQLIAVILVLLGTFLACGVVHIDAEGFKFIDFSSLPWQGIVWGILSAAGYALFIWGSSRLPLSSDPFRNAGMMALGTLPWAIFLYVSQSEVAVSELDMSVWVLGMGWGMLLGGLGHVIPVIGYQLGSATLGAGRSALIGALELPVAIIGSVIFLNESTSYLQAIGVMSIFVGIVLSQLPIQRKNGEGKFF